MKFGNSKAKREEKEQKNRKRQAALDLVYLISCAVNSVVPEKEIIEKMQLRDVYAMSKFHNLSAMACMALESSYPQLVTSFPDMELMKKWQEQKNLAIRKSILFDLERARLYDFLDSQGIWYVPLKGIILKDYYPKAGMRQMSDNDILFDASCADKVRDWFMENGYTTEIFGKGAHDSYHKLPVYNFEMHTSLFAEGHDPLWVEYYTDIKERNFPDADGSMRYHFSNEDFYIYSTLHACKHYRGSGIGLRSLVDTCLYNRAKQETLDRGYIEAELKKLKADQFEQISRELGEKLYSKPWHCTVSQIRESFSEKEQQMLDYLLFSGTYGTKENNIIHNLRKQQSQDGKIHISTKIRYCFRRVFPEMSYYRDHFPFIYRHKYFIPFFLVYRCVVRISDHGSELWKEIKTVWKN